MRKSIAIMLFLFVLSTCLMVLADFNKEKDKTKKVECPIIGIHLGTTNSCIGIYKNGQVEIIPNELGNRITPSVVGFTDEGRVIGEAAKNQAIINPTRTLYDIKRLIGRRYTNKTIQNDKQFLPFDIIDNNGKPNIKVSNVKDGSKVYTPEEIFAIILVRMKEIAENYLGYKVANAIVTVPAYFNDDQRQATKDAGIIAGLNIFRILNEPTSAAIAYGLEKKFTEKNIIVFDLGGGTFDVSILTMDYGVFEVISTSGDTHLGGEDFDQRVMDHFIKLIKNQHKRDISNDKRAIQKLKLEVEKSQKALSSTLEVKIQIENLQEGFNMDETLTRTRFEELNADLFNKIVGPIQTALDDAHLQKNQIDEIVLVGGSTRIPKVRQIVKDFFNGKEPNTGINPEEAIAYGAAVQGGIICEESKNIGCVFSFETTPLSLGIETVDGVMSIIILKGTIIPTKKSQVFTTFQDNQQTFTIKVFEGERLMTKDNHFLDKFDLIGIPPAARGVPQIKVTFEIDENRTLQVFAEDKGAGIKNQITITNDQQGRLSQEEIEKILMEAELFNQNAELSELEKEIKEKIEAKNSLEIYLYQMKNTLEDPEKQANKLSEEDKKFIKDALSETLNWLENNQNAEKFEFEKQLKNIEEICNPIISKVYKEQQRLSINIGKEVVIDDL